MCALEVNTKVAFPSRISWSGDGEENVSYFARSLRKQQNASTSHHELYPLKIFWDLEGIVKMDGTRVSGIKPF